MAKSNSENVYDIVMVGSGPAALSAAIYTTREDLSTLLIEKGMIGGLAATTDWIDNYPGFTDGISGLALSEAMRGQAERFGAKFMMAEVINIQDEGAVKRIITTDGDVLAKSVLLATGSDHKKLGIPGEQEYYARGVHYCATCDGVFYRDKTLAVIGGGNSAVQEAIFLSRFATHIDLLVRSELKASDVLLRELDKHSDKISVYLQAVPTEIRGDGVKLTELTIADGKNGDMKTFRPDGVFVFIGLKPNSGFLVNSKVALDDFGFIRTNDRLETSMAGVFSAGDVRSGATMQIASAVGEGATVALRLRQYLENLAN